MIWKTDDVTLVNFSNAKKINTINTIIVFYKHEAVGLFACKEIMRNHSLKNIFLNSKSVLREKYI